MFEFVEKEVEHNDKKIKIRIPKERVVVKMNNQVKSEKLSIRITPQKKEEIEKFASEMGTSKASLVQIAVSEYLLKLKRG